LTMKMKFFPVVYGHHIQHLWSQHIMIMIRDGWSGIYLIIFPTKSICLASNHFSYAEDGVKHVVHLAIAQTLFLYLCHQDLEDALNGGVKKSFQFFEL
jgi:hypothetical protein